MAVNNYSIIVCFSLFAVCANLVLEGEACDPGSPTVILVNGTIYCNEFNTENRPLTPIKGATAKVTCEAAEGKNPITIESQPTDEQGIFEAIFALNVTERTFDDFMKDCRAYLHNSPTLSTCKTKSNAHMEVSGAPLNKYTDFPDEHLKVFTVGPFIYCQTLNPSPIRECAFL